MELNLAAFLRYSTVNGPGKRAVVWVQGCPIRCPGCFNRQMWSPEPVIQCDSIYLAQRIAMISGIRGVTFSGGEPFFQAEALSDLAERLHEAGLDIMTYSGYYYDELHSSPNPSWSRLLDQTDLLVAGPYIDSLQCNLPFIGSSNQEIIALSRRISSPREITGNHAVELTIMPQGDLIISGFPDHLLQGIKDCSSPGDHMQISSFSAIISKNNTGITSPGKET